MADSSSFPLEKDSTSTSGAKETTRRRAILNGVLVGAVIQSLSIFAHGDLVGVGLGIIFILIGLFVHVLPGQRLKPRGQLNPVALGLTMIILEGIVVPLIAIGAI